MLRARILPLATLAVFAAGSGAGPPGPPDFDPDRVPWKRLRFEARKLFLKGTTEIRLSSLASDALGDQLIDVSGTAGSVGTAPGGPATSLLELRSSFAGRDSESRIWFDPHRAFALQRLKLRRGRYDKAYRKIYRFSADGVFSHRRAPRDAGEYRGPAESWGNLQETFYRHPEGFRDCLRIADPAVLFYLVSAADFEDGGGVVTLCAFSGKSLYRVELRPQGRASLPVDYRVTGSGSARPARQADRRRGPIEVVRISATASPLEGGTRNRFELLGFEGDVELCLAGRIPLQVSGRLPGLGRIRAKLTELELR